MAATNPLALLQKKTSSNELDEEDEEEAPQIPKPAMASLSLSLSSLSLSSFPSIAALPSKLHIPSQIASLSHLSLSSSSSKPPSMARSIAISASPLQTPFQHLPRRPGDPSNPAGGRRCSIVWFRNDLRVHDNEALSCANADSLSVLPVFLFDRRDFGKSSSGFDRTGPYRATFLLESVRELRAGLRARGSDLVVRIGRPEAVLAELARAVGAEAVYAHQEVSSDEVKTEEKVAKAMEEEGLEVKFFWGSTLYHIEDLPFDLEQMPSNYGGFREKVQGLGVRKTIEALDRLKGVPAMGDVEAGEIPSLADLGLSPPPSMAQDSSRVAMHASLIGGESQALEKLKRFASEFVANQKSGAKNPNQDSIYGANFSCKISPWLATGCLSPRFMFEELKKAASRTSSGGPGQNKGGMNWLMFELLWRDFFRFITKKYSSRKKTEIVPATACTGALV
ncbi:photolyase/blue-light receptor 2 [Wolffia australiana]